MSVVGAYAPFLVTGLAVGSTYGISAMGLVLTYKTSGLFNFGHGALAAAAAYVFYDLRQRQSLPWPAAAVLVLVLFGAIGGRLLELGARRLAMAPTSAKIVATVGLLIVLQQVTQIRYGSVDVPFRPFLPLGTVRVGSVAVTCGQLIVFGLALASAIGLYTFFRTTRTGLAMRAVVDDGPLLDIAGVDPVQVRRTAWVIGTSFAAVSGCLIADRQQQLDSVQLTLLVVQTFGAAALARFTSLPMAYAGGLIVGVVQAMATKVISDLPGHLPAQLSALPDASAFLILFGFLLVGGRRRLVELGDQLRQGAEVRSRLSPMAHRCGAAVGLGVLAVVPFVVGTKLAIFSAGMVSVALFLSLSVLVRTSGQVSLCHLAFMAVGAATTGHFVTGTHLPWLLAVLLGGLSALPFGAVVAIPAIRLSGLFLGLATLGFGVLMQQLLYTRGFLFGQGAGVRSPRPHVLGLQTDRGYYYVCLLAVVLIAGSVRLVERSRLGRLLRGLGDSPTALVTHGASVNVTRVLVFCFSSFVAGVAGALSGPVTGLATTGSFAPLASLTLLAVLAIAGRGTILPAFVAATISQVLPGYIDSATLAEYLPLVFGVNAIRTSFAEPHRGRDLVLARWSDRIGDRGSRTPTAARLAARRRTREHGLASGPSRTVNAAVPPRLEEAR